MNLQINALKTATFLQSVNLNFFSIIAKVFFASETNKSARRLP